MSIRVTEDPLFKQALASTVRLLARRDYSIAEIRRQLALDIPDAIVEQVIHACIERDWLNERRMIESQVRSRVARGQGPLRIEFELVRRGLARSDIQHELQAGELDWFELARDLAVRRSGNKVPDRSARLKLYAFLQRRGFTHDQASYALQLPELE